MWGGLWNEWKGEGRPLDTGGQAPLPVLFSSRGVGLLWLVVPHKEHSFPFLSPRKAEREGLQHKRAIVAFWPSPPVWKDPRMPMTSTAKKEKSPQSRTGAPIPSSAPRLEEREKERERMRHETTTTKTKRRHDEWQGQGMSEDTRKQGKKKRKRTSGDRLLGTSMTHSSFVFPLPHFPWETKKESEPSPSWWHSRSLILLPLSSGIPYGHFYFGDYSMYSCSALEVPYHLFPMKKEKRCNHPVRPRWADIALLVPALPSLVLLVWKRVECRHLCKSSPLLAPPA